jgi:hypothetical protein
MITVATFIQAAAQALAADSALTAWAQATYGRPQKVYINIDLKNPPGQADCPYVILRPATARIGNAQAQKLAQLEMVCCLYDESFRTYAEDAITEYNGVQRLCELIQLAIRALAALDIGNALLNLLEPDFDTIESFPFFMAGLPLAITEDYVLGADRLEL